MQPRFPKPVFSILSLHLTLTVTINLPSQFKKLVALEKGPGPEDLPCSQLHPGWQSRVSSGG